VASVRRSTRPSIVCSDSLAIAEALVQSIPVPRARAVCLDPTGRHLDKHLASTAPCLVVVASSNAERAVAAIALTKRRRPGAKVLAVGLPNQELSVLRSFEAGADGVVLPGEPLARLRAALSVVLGGHLRPPPASARLLERLIVLEAPRPSGQDVRANRVFARLSPRELELLRCVAEGATNKEIAVRLHLEVQTVKNYVTRLLRKLRVRSRYDAARAVSALEAYA
jgi:DNA-binding NarL/FixJ family response regulator